MNGAIPAPRKRYRPEEAVSVAKSLPPLSPLVRHLLATISSPDDDASLNEIASWIEKDTMTAGKVLAVANSAMYGRLIPTLSIRGAVARLGLNPLRNLLFHESMLKLWSQLPTPAHWSGTRFNTHSLATAVFSEIIASALTPQDVPFAFCAGLFHDTGRVIIAVLLRDEPEALQQLNRHAHQELEELEKAAVGFTHSEMSALLARSWNLPPAIETAVRYHENPSQDPGYDDANGVPLSHIVNAADWCVDCQGFSIDGAGKEVPDKAGLLSQFNLGIDDTLVFARFQSELEILLNIL